MADTRLPDRWLMDREMRRLSNGAWRLFTGAMMFCNQQLTDGVIHNDELRFLHQVPSDAECDELIAAGLWSRVGATYVFSGWDKGLGQTTREKFEADREKNRRNVAASRKRKKEEAAAEGRVSDVVTGYVTGEVSGAVGEERSGEERQGQDQFLDNVTPLKSVKNEVSWPVVSVPGEEWSSSDEKAF